MKNIVFDLGGVVFARDPRKCTSDFIDFFAFIRAEPMPRFWEEYDRGTLTLDEVRNVLCREKGCTQEVCAEYLAEAIGRQEAVPQTERLIADLDAGGYRLYVLSNMSREFIEFLRLQPVYRRFAGEVISCEERTVKPEPAIYRILLDRYALRPEETLFIDDRPANLDAASAFGLNTFLFRYRDPEGSCDELRRMLL